MKQQSIDPNKRNVTKIPKRAYTELKITLTNKN